MRVALLSLPDHAHEVLGRMLVDWQCAMALALGCERILLVAPALTDDALDVQRQTESAGAKFQIVPHAHRLLGQLKTDDDLLVLDPRLLTHGESVKEMLEQPRRLFVMPESSLAEKQSGFERLDRETEWAGAMWLPGALVEQLSDLPSDAEPRSALLRIAAASGLRRRSVQTDRTVEARWQAIQSAEDARRAGRRITAQMMGPAPHTPGGWILHRAVRAALTKGTRPLAMARLSVAIALCLVLGSGALLANGLPLWSVGVATLAWLVSQMFEIAGKISGRKAVYRAILPLLSLLTLLGALSVMIEADWGWALAAFVSVMVAAWCLEVWRSTSRLRSWFADGLVLGLIVGVSGLLGHSLIGAAVLITAAIAAIWAPRIAAPS